MKYVFVDTWYFVALFNPKDQWHSRAVTAAEIIAEDNLITTEEVLIELLNFFSGHGEKARRGAVAHTETILTASSIDVVPQDHHTFTGGFDLYKARPDKGYSLTDCISMHTMRTRGIEEVLTHDEHFRQEGFKLLL